MKNILLLVHDDPGQEARFQAALDLVRALDGHLVCLDVRVVPVVVDDVFAIAAEAHLFADECDRERANRARLEARLGREGVRWTWIDASGTLASALEVEAKMADLIVVNRRLDSTSSPDMRYVAGQVAIVSGKPVVAVPESARSFAAAAGSALIAWDGSETAMKAVQASLPLLRLAARVTIVELADQCVETPAEEVAAYLSRHDVHAEIRRREADFLSVADALIAEAEAAGADYVVMGGFGHSRVAEALFGGASRDMLSESPIPLVMAH